MAITNELEFQTTALLNTTLGGSITLDGAVMTPGQVDDAFREQMAYRARAVTRHVAKAAGTYAAAKADHNQFWRCTGAVTINLAAAAALTDGWSLWLRANGGAVTLDPSGVETIDGATTKVLPDGQMALVICNGTTFYSVLSGEPVGPTVVSKSAGYTTLQSDLGSLIRFSAAGTLSLTAAATLGTNWSCWVLADGGDVLIDPNASETVNGLTTITIPNGCGGLLVCTGTAFYLVGGARGRMIVEDQYAPGTQAGTFTSGADRTRLLSTMVSSTISGASLTANQITLPVGTYDIAWSCPAYQVNGHQSFLYNVTDAVVIARGQSSYAISSGGVQTSSDGRTTVTITTSKVFEIRHRCATTSATFGFGNPAGFGTEVYTRVTVEKIG